MDTDEAADSVVKCRFSCAVFAAPNRRAARTGGASGNFTDKHEAELQNGKLNKMPPRL